MHEEDKPEKIKPNKTVIINETGWKYAYKAIELVAEFVGSIAFIVIWVLGIVIAKGFWSTFFAVFVFWGWYLVVEKFASLWCLF